MAGQARTAATKATKIKPQFKVGEKDNLNRHWRGLFLDTLAETSNVSAAARMAGINPSRAYKVRREEPAFAASWYDALLEGYAHLEMETLHRLRAGTGKDDNKFDIANALRLLTHHRETVAHERSIRSHQDEESILASLNEKIDAIRAREAQVKILLADGEQATNGLD
ncbi:hypothetical protein GCM10009127_07520 [Alteraurantiacibacter aestuarii]|uniref:Terminase n=1 Tax=Alteraurantiacibacter aestuarii TaxID=650004 RepID=A0A844ZHV4_9SPHN|nr:hypothetical protein [Alteraurantiacibacter aestuarii]MXO87144.1 hypothetical protein [Alteraurantiacibacter aestuarii]